MLVRILLHRMLLTLVCIPNGRWKFVTITLSQSATIYALCFLEAGNSWYELKEFEPFNLYRSAGVGVRVFLPMFGMLGIDWGYGFDDVPGRPGASGSQIHFVLGQEF